MGKVDIAEIGTDQVGTDQVGTDQVGTDQVGTDQVCTRLACPQWCLCKITTQISVTQICTGEIDTTEPNDWVYFVSTLYQGSFYWELHDPCLTARSHTCQHR